VKGGFPLSTLYLAVELEEMGKMVEKRKWPGPSTLSLVKGRREFVGLEGLNFVATPDIRGGRKGGVWG